MLWQEPQNIGSLLALYEPMSLLNISIPKMIHVTPVSLCNMRRVDLVIFWLENFSLLLEPINFFIFCHFPQVYKDISFFEYPKAKLSSQ